MGEGERSFIGDMWSRLKGEKGIGFRKKIFDERGASKIEGQKFGPGAGVGVAPGEIKVVPKKFEVGKGVEVTPPKTFFEAEKPEKKEDKKAA